jgi:hypothetical protein
MTLSRNSLEALRAGVRQDATFLVALRVAPRQTISRLRLGRAEERHLVEALSDEAQAQAIFDALRHEACGCQSQNYSVHAHMGGGQPAGPGSPGINPGTVNPPQNPPQNCVADPCSNDPNVLHWTKQVKDWSDNAGAATGAYQHFYAQQAAMALAHLEAARAQCVAAHNGATTPLVVGPPPPMAFNNFILLGGPGFQIPVNVFTFTPVLTFDPPFFTSVQLAAIPPLPANLEATGLLDASASVSDLAASGTYDRCTGAMDLTLGFTVTSKSVNPSEIPKAMQIDTCVASVSTSFHLPTSAQQSLWENFSFNFLQDFAFTKVGSIFSAQMSGHVSLQGGFLASMLGPGALLFMGLEMPGPFPLV